MDNPSPSNSIAMGTANRINAYRKTVVLSTQKSNPNLNDSKNEKLRDSVLNLHKQNKTETDLTIEQQLNDSKLEKNSYHDQLKDFDLSQTAQNLKETEQVIEILQAFEKNYFEAKIKMNLSDLSALDADVTAQTLSTCYQIVSRALPDEILRFDRDKIDQKLEKISCQVKQNNQEWNNIKGEFQAIHEPVINKDILTFKIDGIQKNLERQESIIQKYPGVQKNIRENKQQLSDLKEAFEKFESEIFKIKYAELQQVKKNTEEIIVRISEQKITLEAKIDAAKQLIECVVPLNKDQTQKLMNLQLEVSKIQQHIEQSMIKNKKLLVVVPSLQEKFDQISQNMKYVSQMELQDMVTKSKKLQILIDNSKDWKEIHDQFQELTNHDFVPIQFDSQKILDESKNLLDLQAAQKKGEFDDIINQIQKLSQKLKQETSDQSGRLEKFEKDLLSPQNSQVHNISDQDLFFLKKEVSKDKSSLQVINGLVNEVLKNSLQIMESCKNYEVFGHAQANNFTDNDFLNLKANLKVLQKQNSIDFPRVRQNIDQLENFSSKLLKNGLNDDNKKSQNMISKMKKNYEDLQKIIDNLNTKLMKDSKAVASLKDLFQNQDLDRDFQFKTKLDDILEKCAQEINSLEPIKDMNSLQLRKKEIIGGINSLVSQFNDNNKQLKQTNKDVGGEGDVLDLVKKNQQIQKECDDLEKKIAQAKEFAEEINNLLDQQLEVNFLKLQDEFENKNRLIDICDENFDKLNTKIQDDEDILSNEINKLNQLIEKLEEISPLNQPLPNDADNQQFKQNIINFLEKARNLREEIEEQKQQIEIVKDEMLMVVQPLNELAERPVFTKDVQNIYDKLQQLTSALTIIDDESTPKHFRVQQIMKQVEDTLEQGKLQKVNEIEKKYNEFDDILNQLLQEKKNAEESMAKLSKLIDFAMKDPMLMNEPASIEKIRNAEAQQKQLEKDLRDIDAKIQDVLKKKIDTRKVVEDIKRNTKNFSPQQLQVFISALDDQVDKVKNNLDRTLLTKEIEIKTIEDMNNLIGERQQKAQALQDFNDIKDQVNDDLQTLSKVLDQLPDQIAKLLLTNLEMQKDSADQTCDYWEERKKIAKNIEVLSKIKPQIGKIKTDLVKFQNQSHHLYGMVKPTTQSDIVNKILNELKDLQSMVIDHLNQAVTISDDTEQIKHQMGDCEIPINIQVRKNELQNFSDKLQNVTADFTEMNNTHLQSETDGDIGSTQIDIILSSLQEKFKPIQKEEATMKEYLKKHLEAYRESDFTSFDNLNIIKEVLEFKKRIRDGLEIIKEIETMCNDLNTKMVQQDIDNAAHLLGKRTLKLKSRLLTASEVLKKISKAGNQMDGNTTQTEEDDFIEALKEEMPEVFKNIEQNQANLDQIEKAFAKITQSKNIDLMGSIKKQIDDLEKKVQQSESLALKLENEIIEWNGQKKLIRRDEEMIELTNICAEIKEDIRCEEDLMHAEYEKNQQKMKAEGDSSGQLINMNKGIASYVLELEELKNIFISFDLKRETLYAKFDPELPKSVIDFRYKQKANNKIMKGRKENPHAQLWDKDIYYMIGANCKHRGSIHELLKELRQINQIRKDLDGRYAKLKNDLVNFKPKGSNYKAVKGDAIDELFSKILNSVGINIPIKRLAVGKYLFGTRQIMAKIINGKLVIRVGGGYMSAEEFIEQYGAIELEKMMKAGTILEQPGQFDSLKGMEGGAISIAEMKQILKEQLFQVKLYSRDDAKRESNIGNPFGQKQGILLLNDQPQSLLQVEQNYEAIKFGKPGTTKTTYNKLSVSPMRSSKRNLSPLGLTPNKNSRQ